MDIRDITDIVQAIAVVVVAVPAVKGLTLWRDQLIGAKKIELAEEVLILAYVLQGAIEWARHPASFGGEGADREGRDQEPADRRTLNDAYYSRVSRLSEHDDDFARLRLASMRFRAFFSDEGQDALSVFHKIRNKTNTAVGMLIEKTGDGDYSQDLVAELQAIIWDHSSDDKPDDVRKQVDDAVTEIENICRPILTKS